MTKYIRIDSWGDAECPCCKQMLSIIAAVPAETTQPIMLAMTSGWSRYEGKHNLLLKQIGGEWVEQEIVPV